MPFFVFFGDSIRNKTLFFFFQSRKTASSLKKPLQNASRQPACMATATPKSMALHDTCIHALTAPRKRRKPIDAIKTYCFSPIFMIKFL